jgi:hypothetical protein
MRAATPALATVGAYYSSRGLGSGTFDRPDFFRDATGLNVLLLSTTMRLGLSQLALAVSRRCLIRSCAFLISEY